MGRFFILNLQSILRISLCYASIRDAGNKLTLGIKWKVAETPDFEETQNDLNSGKFSDVWEWHAKKKKIREKKIKKSAGAEHFEKHSTPVTLS